MEANYGWSGWNPPDAGDAIQQFESDQFGKFNGMATLGGGTANNDGRFIKGVAANMAGQRSGLGESALDFLKHRAGKLNKPFCLFVSLVNPHDVYVYPTLYQKAGYRREDFANLGIGLPPNADDNLSTKPSVQKAARDAFDKVYPLENDQQRLEYVNFYGYLQTLVDRHIGMVLDTLEETGLLDNSIVIRLADHGEGGLSHGMREKAYTAYEEMIHIPLIVHNRRLFPELRPAPSTTTLMSCRPFSTLPVFLTRTPTAHWQKHRADYEGSIKECPQPHLVCLRRRLLPAGEHARRAHSRHPRRRLDLRSLLRTRCGQRPGLRALRQ
jgi:choline-sulfatase